MGGNPTVPNIELIPENTFIEVPLDNESLVILDCLVMKGRTIIPSLQRSNMQRQRENMASTMFSFFLKRMKAHPQDWDDLIREAIKCRG